jgi:protein-tyrosine-phosphatase
MRIHFIRRGNGLRSTMAEAYARSLNILGITVVSTGAVAETFITAGLPVSANALAVLREHNIEQFVKRERTQLTSDLLHADDLVVCMNQRVYDEAKTIVSLPKSTQVWDVADLGEGTRTYRNETEALALVHDMFDEIKMQVDDLVKALPQAV